MELLIWILFALSFLSLGIAFLSSFTYVSRTSLSVDLIAHSTLLGIALSLWIEKKRDFYSLFFFSIVVAIISFFLFLFWQRKTSIRENTLLIILLTFFFGSSMLLFSYLQQKSDVFLAGIEKFLIGSLALLTPPEIFFVGVISFLVALFSFIKWYEWKYFLFDREFSLLLGIRRRKMQGYFLFFVGITSFLAIQVVGPVLAISYFVFPPLVGYLFSRGFSSLVFEAFGVSFLGSIGGILISYYLEIPPGVTISLVLGGIFLLGSMVYALLQSRYSS